MTADQCKACPFPDQTAALELVRLREGIRRLADTIEGDYGVAHNYRCEGEPDCLACIVADLRALLDDNEGERS